MTSDELIGQYDKECGKTDKLNSKLKNANMFTFWYYSIKVANSYAKRNELLEKLHTSTDYRNYMKSLTNQ